MTKTLPPLACTAALALAACATTPGTGGPGTQVCHPVTEPEVAALFDRWNQSLATGDPKKVVANYAPDAILLPTVSNQPRQTPAAMEDYFKHFLVNRPSGKIDLHHVDLGCNSVVDAGLYTFTFAKTGQRVPARYTYTYRWNGREWLITSHHSSMMPEKVPAKGH